MCIAMIFSTFLCATKFSSSNQSDMIKTQLLTFFVMWKFIECINWFVHCLMLPRYQIGLRYTGGARMLLMLSLKFGVIPIVVPVGVRNFDIDGELWVKLRLIQTEPWVGAVSWAFVSLPKIKLDLSPFRLFNLMGMWNSIVRAIICEMNHVTDKNLGV